MELSVASGDATETLDTDFCTLVCQKFWADCVPYLH
jgi:hypothetical protein